MKRTAVILLTLLSISAFSGCSASGPAFARREHPDPNQALVYIYRPANLIGAASVTTISIDAEDRGQLKEKGYLVFDLKPGKRMIEARYWGTPPLTLYLDAAAGEEYFLRWFVDIGEGYGISHTLSFGQIPSEYALREIQYTKLSVKKSE